MKIGSGFQGKNMLAATKIATKGTCNIMLIGTSHIIEDQLVIFGICCSGFQNQYRFLEISLFWKEEIIDATCESTRQLVPTVQTK